MLERHRLGSGRIDDGVAVDLRGLLADSREVIDVYRLYPVAALPGSANSGIRRRIQAMLLVRTSRSPPKTRVGRTIEYGTPASASARSTSALPRK